MKQLVRNIIEPDRDLGHVDRHQKKLDEPAQRQLEGGEHSEELGSSEQTNVARARQSTEGLDCENCG